MSKKLLDLPEEEAPVWFISTLFGARTQQGYVQVEVAARNFAMQMTPQDARAVALNLLEAAEAAEQDSIFVEYMRKRVGMDDSMIFAVLGEFRNYRNEMQERQR